MSGIGTTKVVPFQSSIWCSVLIQSRILRGLSACDGFAAASVFPGFDVDDLVAGEVGVFSPRSCWPIGVAGAATVAGFGLAFYQLWLFLIGVLGILTTVAGLLFEYYIGGMKPLSGPEAPFHYTEHH